MLNGVSFAVSVSVSGAYAVEAGCSQRLEAAICETCGPRRQELGCGISSCGQRALAFSWTWRFVLRHL